MRIAITIGDPVGIGPEVILKALQHLLPDEATPIIFGAQELLVREDARLLRILGSSWKPLTPRLTPVLTPDAYISPGCIGVIDVRPDLDLDSIIPGKPDARAAHLQGTALDHAIHAALTGQVDAIVTAPWTKSIFALIGRPTTGHTEVLAKACDAPEHVMMLAGDVLRVSLVTTHIPLKSVSSHITRERVIKVLSTTLRDLDRLFGIQNPRVAVCGLNPHAGEHGVMGHEEDKVIKPALAQMRQDWPDAFISDPLPSDTLFSTFHAQKAPFDAVLCMYHDQGLIPLKLMHFGRSANITLGLPIIRTSVDHGTAYDIAGKGIADAGSMQYALEQALHLVYTSRTHKSQ